MRVKAGTASSSGQLSVIEDTTIALARVLSIEFHARSDNASAVYFGESDVSASNGRELLAGEVFTFDFSDGNSNPSSPAGSVLFNTFHVAVTGNAKIDWTVILF